MSVRRASFKLGLFAIVFVMLEFELRASCSPSELYSNLLFIIHYSLLLCVCVCEGVRVCSCTCVNMRSALASCSSGAVDLVF